MTGKDLQKLLVRVRIIDEARLNSLNVVHGRSQALTFMVVKSRDINGASR